MKRFTLISMVLIAVCATFVAPAVAQHEHPPGDPGKLGKVNFPVFCAPAIQAQFSSAVAMLHSFWYEKASDTFAALAEKDPTCGMAYWGIAMTLLPSHLGSARPGGPESRCGGRRESKVRQRQNPARTRLHRRHRDVLQGQRQA